MVAFFQHPRWEARLRVTRGPRLSERKEHDEERHAYLLEEVSRRQRNTLWPDAMVNSSSVDALLWKGSPKATKVQRVGIVIWA